jgi:hypothetical protein
MRHTNRPTIIDLRDLAGFLGERGDNTKRNATRDTGPSTNQPAPIQHGNTQHDLPPTPPRRRGGRAERAEAAARRRSIRTAFENAGLWLDRDGADDPAVDELVARGVVPGEVRRRMLLLLETNRTARPAELAARWDQLDPPAPAAVAGGIR